VVGIDTDESVLQAIRDGFITGTMAQNPYAMAYISVYGLKLQAEGMVYKADSPFNVDSGTFFVDKSNVDNVNGELAKVTKDLLESVTGYFE
jgi:ribose transport system substrate-binding protein